MIEAAQLVSNMHMPCLTHVFLTLGAHAQQGLRYLVCLSVCHPEFWHYRLCGGHSAIPAASALQGHENERGVFPETTVLQRYGVKTSKKANG